MSQFLMQARSSDTGLLYTWTSATADFAGAGYGGPGDPEEIAVVEAAITGEGGEPINVALFEGEYTDATRIDFVSGFSSTYDSLNEILRITATPATPTYPTIKETGTARTVRAVINVHAPLHATDSASPAETEVTYKEGQLAGNIVAEGGTVTADPNNGSAVTVHATVATILEIVADGQKVLFSVALEPTSSALVEIRRAGFAFTHITLDNAGDYNWVDMINMSGGWTVYRAGKTDWPVS